MSGEANIWQPRNILEADANSRSLEEKLTASIGQTLFTLTSFAYTISTGSLEVHKNGLLLTKGTDWQEQTTTTFSIVVPCNAGDIVVATGIIGNTANVDVRDTDIFISNYQALRDYVGTEVTIYAQGAATHADGGATFFGLVTSEAPGFFVDDNDSIIVPTGGDGSFAWLRQGSKLKEGVTLTSVVNDKRLRLGDIRKISDRGDGSFTAVLASGVTPNTFDIIQCVGVATLALVLRPSYTLDVDHFGAGVGGIVTGAIQAVYTKAATLPFGARIEYNGEEYIHGDIFFSSDNSAITVKGRGKPKITAAAGTHTLYWFGFTAADVVANVDTNIDIRDFNFDGDSVAQRTIMLYRCRFKPTIKQSGFVGFLDACIRTRLVGDPNADAGSSNVVNLDASNNTYLTSGPGSKAIVLGYDCQLVNVSHSYFRNNDANPDHFIICGHTAGLAIAHNQMFRPASGDYTLAKSFVICNHGSGAFRFDHNSMVASHDTVEDLPSYLEMDATGASSTSYASIAITNNDWQDEGNHYHPTGFIKWSVMGAGTLDLNNNRFSTPYDYSASGKEAFAPPIRIFNKFNFLIESFTCPSNSWDNLGTVAGTADRLLIGQDASDGTANFRINAFSGMLREGFHTSGIFNLSTDTDIIDLSLRNRELLSTKFVDRRRMFKYDATTEDTWIEVFTVTFDTASTSYMGFEFSMLMNSETGGVQFYKVGYQLQGSTGVAGATEKWTLGTVPAGDGGSGALPATTTDNIWWFEEDAANETVKFYVKKDDVTDVLITEMNVMECPKQNQAAGLTFSWNEALFYEY